MQSNINNSYCDDDLLFIDLWCEYEEYLKVKSKYQTYSKIIERVNNHILPFFKDMKINDISHRDIIAWMNNINKKEYSYNYCSALHTALSSIFEYGVKYYNLKNNMAKKVGNFAKNKNQREIQFWTFEEYKKFINVVDNEKYRVFFETLYSTGIRQGEARALTWNDLKENYIEINKTISRARFNGDFVINSPKTKSSMRIVYIDDKLKKSLLHLLKTEKKKKDFNINWYIFGGEKPLSVTTIDRRKNKYCDMSNVKKIRIHDFRHSHATLLLSRGVPITAISKRLGHSNTEMTLNTYSHLYKEDELKAVALLNSLKA